MREEGKSVKHHNERRVLNTISGESITVPGAGGPWGDYTVKLAETPHESYDVIVAGGFTETDTLPVSANEFYVYYEQGLLVFNSADAATNTTVSYKGRGTSPDAIDANAVQTLLCVPVGWVGEPVVTSDGDYMITVPLASTESASGFGTADLSQLEAQGFSVFCQSPDFASADTTFVLSNAKKAGGGDTLTCTLTHTGAETDRRVSAQGSVVFDLTSDAVYIYCTAATSPCHANFTFFVWFRRVAP